MPRLLCVVDPDGRPLLTRTYGGAPPPTFPTVALMSACVGYADHAGATLRRVATDDFRLAFRRAACGTLFALVTTVDDDDETSSETRLRRCERVLALVAGARDVRHKHAARAARACLDLVMHEPTHDADARDDHETNTDAALDDHLSAATIAACRSRPSRRSVPVPATAAVTNDGRVVAANDAWRASMDAEDVDAVGTLLSSLAGDAAVVRDVPVHLSRGKKPARVVMGTLSDGARAVVVGIRNGDGDGDDGAPSLGEAKGWFRAFAEAFGRDAIARVAAS